MPRKSFIYHLNAAMEVVKQPGIGSDLQRGSEEPSEE